MRRGRQIRRSALGSIVALALVATACSGDDSDATGTAPVPTAAEESSPTPAPEPTATSASEPTPAPEPTPTPEPRVATPTHLVALEDGAGAPPIQSSPVPESWTVVEYAMGGEATSYRHLSEPGTDGFWDVEADATAEYRTRLLVRTPPAEAFSGVVVVEWFNVTAGTDVSPDWGFLSEEIIRRGHAYIGVSAQEVSVHGSERDFVGGGLVDTRGLAIRMPERYGDLVHPGDSFAYDIFSQVAVVAADVVGHEPDLVIAMGESQSAGFLTGYVNGVHPEAGVYDGFLIHSRGGAAPDAAGTRNELLAGGVQVRTDLNAPVLMLEAETDLSALGYAGARQEDTNSVRTWEIAGTAHTDAHTLAAAAGLPRDPVLGVVIGCTEPINDGPHHEVALAALSHLVAWAADGTLPPASPRLEVSDDGQIVRDELGIALGGIRTPPVDVPLRVLSGEPGTTEGACWLFGSTLEIGLETLQDRYPSLDDYRDAAAASAASAVENGWLLQVDADEMVEIEVARAESLGLS